MTEDRLDTPEAIEKARERDQRPCVWDEGAVPRHVAEFLWDAVHDRHVLLAALAAVSAERDALRLALADLERAASEYADSTGGISGGLGARLSDARALLAAHRSLR